MISDHSSAIEDIVNTFQNQQMPNVSQETQSWILMEILGAIPEEVTHLSYQQRSSKILRKIPKMNAQSAMPFSSRNWFLEVKPHSIDIQTGFFFNYSHRQTNIMYTSVQRVAVQNEICKRTPFVINTVQQFILSKIEHTFSEDAMASLLRAVKCLEAWLK